MDNSHRQIRWLENEVSQLCGGGLETAVKKSIVKNALARSGDSRGGPLRGDEVQYSKTALDDRGVRASFACLGAIIIAEPGALIGFAGPRVIEQTIRQELPQGFQRSEFLLDQDTIGIIFPRKELPAKVQELVTFFSE